VSTGTSLSLEVVRSIGDIARQDWESLRRDPYPFLDYDFLLGLETSGSTTASSGWQPCHFLLRSGAAARLVLPAYLKSHSYGEYVFDWSWADAWRQCGLAYYPKLVTAIPFTPAHGPRLLASEDLDAGAAWELMLPAVTNWLRDEGLSSWHILFPPEQESDRLSGLGLAQRRSVQFHWFNRGYTTFDDFLATFSSRKRKSLRRERRRIEEQGLTLERLTGAEVSAHAWETFHRFYQLTYAKRSGHGGYLSREFFTEVCPRLGDQVMLVLARDGGEPVAGSLFFRGGDVLYGRYWGCVREYDCLHFEACYYQGIEYCIEQGLGRFDPGAQGEHKIQRGFEPVQTTSSHWIAEPELARAVADFARRERHHIDAYQTDAATYLPFREPG